MNDYLMSLVSPFASKEKYAFINQTVCFNAETLKAVNIPSCIQNLRIILAKIRIVILYNCVCVLMYSNFSLQLAEYERRVVDAENRADEAEDKVRMNCIALYVLAN